MPRSKGTLQLHHIVVATILWFLALASAHGSGPRYVTGPPFFTAPAGQPIGWRQPTLQYFTDPGALSLTVSHAAADALVASAATIWNVPVASITLTQGGALAEHVSSANSYLSSSGMVFPADVLAANASAVPIAIVYDSDGSVTDMLLGSGASQPSSCRQNAVTESVDAFDPAGYILHAIIILNGRCTGPIAEQQLQMQYQLERAFGRVLGLAWSQLNDNVFTGSPTPTYTQAQHWPIMHPIDIVCGPYTFQCLPQPFTLRPDDIASLVQIYPIAANAAPDPGKQPSLFNASSYVGHVSFPTGEGMEGVNVLVRRELAESPIPDDYFVASAITGFGFRRASTPPFLTPGQDALASLGTSNPDWQGYYILPYIPLEDTSTYNWQKLIFSTEAVNPLYTGPHSVGPYSLGGVRPSGTPPSPVTTFYNVALGEAAIDFRIPNAASTCGNGADGTASAPVPVPAGGWWTGLICGYAHASYLSAQIKANRTFTVEVMALDEQALPTESKAMPVIALYAPGDSTPSLGFTAAAFQSRSFATTTLTGSVNEAIPVTIAIADQRSDGRPDFPFQARLFYADAVAPSTLPLAGGTLTLTGTGFRSGNAVTINHQPVTVLTWTSTSITLLAPSMASISGSSGIPLDITVSDLSTGATSTLSAALTYQPAPTRPNVLRLLSAPTGTVFVGDAAPARFALQLLAPDGQTPLPGAAITLAATAGSVAFVACPVAPPCTLLTDSNGTASTLVTPQTPGTITLQASSGALLQSASFTAQAQPGSLQILDVPTGPVLVGNEASHPFFVRLLDSAGNGLPSQPITFKTLTGAASLRPCFTSPCTVTADQSGAAAVFLTPTAPGTVILQASVGDLHQQVTITAVPNADTLEVLEGPPAAILVDSWPHTVSVRLLHGDGSPDVLEPITILTSQASALSIDQCGLPPCTFLTDWTGIISFNFTAHQPGSVSITTGFGSLIQTISFTVTPHTVQFKILSAPSGSIPVGQLAAAPFTVQLLQDGTVPLVNADMVLEGPPGAVALNNCPGSSCELYTDANGIASVNVTPITAGVIHLSAVFPPISQEVSFTALGQPQAMRIVLQPPPAGTLVGDIPAFETELIGADGLTPIVNLPVTYSVLSGPFVLLTCGYASCTGNSDPNGRTMVWGQVLAPGRITLQAVTGTGLSQTTTFTASAAPSSPQQYDLTSSPAQTFLAAGATLTLPLTANVTLNGSPAPGQTITWSSTPGFAPAVTSTVTAADGSASTPAVLGPLPSGASAFATVCGPGNLCQPLTATAVDPAVFLLTLVSEDANAVTTPVVVRVTDTAGHPIASAPITVSQTVTALDASCPTHGRCPAAPVLASRITSTISGVDGTLAVTPLTVPGTPTQTELAISSGTQAFLSTVLTSH